MVLTTAEILHRNGLSRELAHNPKITKQLAAALVKRGFRKIQIMRDGKRLNVWTNEVDTPFDPEAMLDKILGSKT